MKQKVSQELLDNFSQAQSIEEVKALAQKADIELSEDEATMFLSNQKTIVDDNIQDEELQNVAGGLGKKKCYHDED